MNEEKREEKKREEKGRGGRIAYAAMASLNRSGNMIRAASRWIMRTIPSSRTALVSDMGGRRPLAAWWSLAQNRRFSVCSYVARPSARVWRRRQCCPGGDAASPCHQHHGFPAPDILERCFRAGEGNLPGTHPPREWAFRTLLLPRH